ncbi:MAG: hypothetical protein ACRD1T_18525, partial [Acidimicrobiia bacterium]
MRLVEGEKSTVAILVTDVEGSTQLRGRFGGTVADEILGLHEDIVRRGIGSHSGREVNFMGDGFMAVFETPLRRARRRDRHPARLRGEGPDRPAEHVEVSVPSRASTARPGTICSSAGPFTRPRTIAAASRHWTVRGAPLCGPRRAHSLRLRLTVAPPERRFAPRRTSA